MSTQDAQPTDRRTYLVTGAAGFIGSHLCEALLERGDRVVGLDAFTDYYARSDKEANLRGLRERPGFTLVEEDLNSRQPAGARRRHGRRLPPGRPARRPGQLRRHVLDLPQRQPDGDPARLRDRRSRRPPRRLRVVLVGLRQRQELPDHRAQPGPPGVALRRDEALLRAPGRLLRRRPRPRRDRHALLHRLRPAPAPRHGHRADLPRAALRRPASRSSARASSRATSPSSSTR